MDGIQLLLAVLIAFFLAVLIVAALSIRDEISQLRLTLENLARRRSEQRQKLARDVARLWQHHTGENGIQEKPDA